MSKLKTYAIYFMVFLGAYLISHYALGSTDKVSTKETTPSEPPKNSNELSTGYKTYSNEEIKLVQATVNMEFTTPISKTSEEFLDPFFTLSNKLKLQVKKEPANLAYTSGSKEKIYTTKSSNGEYNLAFRFNTIEDDKDIYLIELSGHLFSTESKDISEFTKNYKDFIISSLLNNFAEQKRQNIANDIMQTAIEMKNKSVYWASKDIDGFTVYIKIGEGSFTHFNVKILSDKESGFNIGSVTQTN